MEELTALLKHFQHHTEHHNEDLRSYMEQLRAAGKEELAQKLELCINYQNQVKTLLDEVLKELEK